MTFSFFSHSWIKDYIEMFGIPENVRNLLKMSMEQWNLLLALNGEDLEVVNVKRGIFQGPSLSPPLFIWSMVPLSLILRKVNAYYEWGKKDYKLNYLL